MQVRVGEVTVADFEAESAKALLAYLMIRREVPSPRELLAGLLWPESPEPEARRNLRSALYRLRLSIGDHEARPSLLKISRDALQLNVESNYWLDVEAFTRLVTSTHAHMHSAVAYCPSCIASLTDAMVLYRGDFMLGFSYDSADFEDWLDLEREALRLQAMEALEHLALHHEQIGDYPQTLAYAHRQLGLEPWRESAHRQAMRALALSGQRASALAQYETCRRVLGEELGIEPEPATEALYEEIRTGRLGQAWAEFAEHLPDPAQLFRAPVKIGPPFEAPPQSLDRAPTAPASDRDARDERHFVTVLVAEIKGAAELLAYTELESWAAELVRILVFLETEGRRFGGTLDHRGHQHLALYFGAEPTPQEDAEQAILAALAMRTAFATQLSGARDDSVPSSEASTRSGEGRLRLRVGVSTGEATVVGSAQTPGARAGVQHDEPTGQWAATIVAERVLEGAPEGPVWVDDRTYRLVPSHFSWGTGTKIAVSGLERPVVLYPALAHKEKVARRQPEWDDIQPTLK